MIGKQKILLIICLFVVCILPFTVSASLPMVQFPLKPSPAEGPYQDEEFLEKANNLIIPLSNQTVPTGIALRNLQSIQQKLSKMSISPEFYNDASNINAFLFYTGKAGDAYDGALSLTSSAFSPVAQDGSQFADAEKFYTAAKIVWERIKENYPDVTLYTLSKKSNDGEDSDSDSDLMFGDYPTSSRGHTGLW